MLFAVCTKSFSCCSMAIRASIRFRISHLIRSGDTYQVNYTYRLSTSLAAQG